MAASCDEDLADLALQPGGFSGPIASEVQLTSVNVLDTASAQNTSVLSAHSVQSLSSRRARDTRSP
jgi:hypothetical protein